MSVEELNEEQFDENVLKSEKPVLVDFWASWCGPCKMLAPEVKALADEHDEFNFFKVNVDECPNIAAKYGISSIPTLIVYKNGVPTEKSVGFKDKARLEYLVK